MEKLLFLLMKVGRLVKQYAKSRLATNPVSEKLSGPRIGVIFILAEAKTMRMRDLAQKLHVNPRTVTDLVDGLEKDGFVSRVPDPQDRRATLLELTPQALENFGAIAHIRNEFVGEMMSVLDEQDKADLMRILLKLKNGPLKDMTCDDDE